MTRNLNTNNISSFRICFTVQNSHANAKNKTEYKLFSIKMYKIGYCYIETQISINIQLMSCLLQGALKLNS